MAKIAVTRYKDLTRWDVKTYLNSLALSHSNLIPFGDLLKRVPIEFEELQEHKEYPIIGVRSYGKGMYHNRIAKGVDLITPTTKSYQKIQKDMLFWCKVDTKNGAFGVTTEEHEGYYASNNMIQVEIQQNKILPKYLQLLFTYKFFQEYLDLHVVGLTNRQYISFTELVNVKIPLPSLAEQQEIVDLWKKAQTESQDALNKVETLKKEIDDYLMSELGITVQKQEKSKVFTTRFKDLERWDTGYNLFPLYQFEKYLPQPINQILSFENREWLSTHQQNTEFPYIQISDVNKENGIFQFSYVLINEAPSRAKTLIKTGDLIISLTRPNLGAFSIISERFNNFVVTSGFVVCNGEGTITNYYVMYLLQSSFGVNLFNKNMTGAVYPAISQEDLGNLQIPLPPMEKQEEIVSHITTLRSQISELNTTAQYTLESTREKIKKMIIS